MSRPSSLMKPADQANPGFDMTRQWRSCIHGFIVAIVLSAAPPSVFASSDQAPAVHVGEAHPYLALQRVGGGEPFVLDRYRGKRVVMLHFAAWDPESTASLAEWKSFADGLKNDDSMIFVGIIHDQHRDRADLFVRWKAVEFPVFHDPLNVISAPRVGRAVCVDGDGLVRAIARHPKEVTDQFLEKEFEPISSAVRPPNPKPPDPRVTQRIAGEGHRPLEIIQHGDALMFSGNPAELDEAIRTYRKAFGIGEPNAAAAFRLGVARRIRFDGPNRRPDDLARACEALRVAAGLAPRNEVFAARVRQIGIATDKHACAFCWIDEARRALGDAGELNPAPWPIEAAKPATAFEAGESSESAPPKIEVGGGACTVEHAVVHALDEKHGGEANLVIAISAGSAQVNAQKPIRVWLKSPDGVELQSRYLEVPATPLAAGHPAVCCVGIRFKKTGESTTHKIDCAIIVETNGGPVRSDHEFTVESSPPTTLKD